MLSKPGKGKEPPFSTLINTDKALFYFNIKPDVGSIIVLNTSFFWTALLYAWLSTITFEVRL